MDIDGKTFVVEVDDLKELLQTHALVDRNDFENLVYYCDLVAPMLFEAGYEGKSQALQDRYMKFKTMLSDKE